MSCANEQWLGGHHIRINGREGDIEYRRAKKKHKSTMAVKEEPKKKDGGVEYLDAFDINIYRGNGAARLGHCDAVRRWLRARALNLIGMFVSSDARRQVAGDRNTHIGRRTAPSGSPATVSFSRTDEKGTALATAAATQATPPFMSVNFVGLFSKSL